MNKAQREALRTGFATDRAKLEKIHKETVAKLRELDSDESRRTYTPQHRESEKERVLNHAREQARALGNDIHKRADLLVQEDAEWNINAMLRRARFCPLPAPMPRTDLMLSVEKQVAEQLDHRALIDSELANSMRAISVREQLSLADDDEFGDIVDEAISANDLAVLNVARALTRQRNWTTDVKAARVKSRFVDLGDRLNMPEREEALAIISESKSLVRECASLVRTIEQGRPEDVSVVLREVNEGKRFWQKPEPAPATA